MDARGLHTMSARNLTAIFLAVIAIALIALALALIGNPMQKIQRRLDQAILKSLVINKTPGAGYAPNSSSETRVL